MNGRDFDFKTNRQSKYGLINNVNFYYYYYNYFTTQYHIVKFYRVLIAVTRMRKPRKSSGNCS